MKVLKVDSCWDSLVVGMSKRICLYEDQAKLTELMEKLEGKFNEGTSNEAMKNIDDNKVWVESEKYNDVSLYISRRGNQES